MAADDISNIRKLLTELDKAIKGQFDEARAAAAGRRYEDARKSADLGIQLIKRYQANAKRMTELSKKK